MKQAAVQRAQPGGAVFLLANEYPRRGIVLDRELLDSARQKRLKLYVEYPERVLGVETGEAQTIVFERLVAPDGFMGALEKGALLMLNGCWHRPYFKNGPGMLCLAKVAGYDRMAFGLPEKYDAVLDWLDDKQDVLLATSCLSQFVTARCLPTGS